MLYEIAFVTQRGREYKTEQAVGLRAARSAVRTEATYRSKPFTAEIIEADTRKVVASYDSESGWR